jgi:hypothetical protein
LKTEVSELHKSKRQLIGVNQLKDLGISEKNPTIRNYLDKIVSFSAFWGSSWFGFFCEFHCMMFVFCCVSMLLVEGTFDGKCCPKGSTL